MKRTIIRDSEYMDLHPDGTIGRPAIKMAPSGQWRVTGAVTRNNFGHVTRRWTFQEIWEAPDKIPWQYANGKQHTFITDYDHGSSREWRSPGHRIF